MKITSWY